MRYAIMRDNLVTGLTTFEDGPPEGWSAGEGLGLFALQDGQNPAPGWVWADGEFQPPSPVELPTEPHRVSRIDFVRLFRVEQQMAVNALRKRVAALQPEDYTNPAQQLFIMLEVVLQQFDLPAEFIELDHPDTATGLGLLAIAGVFGEGNSSAEVARIIRGERPTY